MFYKKSIATIVFFTTIIASLVGSVSMASAATVLYRGVVPTDDVLNVRTGPGASYAKVGQLASGTTVNIYAKKDGYVQISTGKKWVLATYIQKITTQTVAKGAAAASVQISSAPVKTETVSNAAASVASTAVTVPTANCLAAVRRADEYCATHDGLDDCPSGAVSNLSSESKRCVAANNDCNAHINAALAECPSINQQ